MKEYYISITDENDNFICSKVGFDESALVEISCAAGGLGDFIDEYKIRMKGDPCVDCTVYEEGDFNCEDCEEEYHTLMHEELVLQFKAYLDLKKKLNIDRLNKELRCLEEENGCIGNELIL